MQATQQSECLKTKESKHFMPHGALLYAYFNSVTLVNFTRGKNIEIINASYNHHHVTFMLVILVWCRT